MYVEVVPVVYQSTNIMPSKDFIGRIGWLFVRSTLAVGARSRSVLSPLSVLSSGDPSSFFDSAVVIAFSSSIKEEHELLVVEMKERVLSRTMASGSLVLSS